jgi:KaiC/GvpD/RAD55 family RecA-like ATPase
VQLCRLIAPQWLMDKNPDTRRVREGLFTTKQIKEYNQEGYNVYYLPNAPSVYAGGTVDGSQIDLFKWVFVDCDLKDGVYKTKDDFIERLALLELPPTKIVDSGGGVHAYWAVSDLDAMSYLRLSRRLMRLLNTDQAVGQIFQLMRLPNTLNTKRQDSFVPCELLLEDDSVYTCEDLDRALPQLAPEDEAHCQQHFNKTYDKERQTKAVDLKMPAKWGTLLNANPEAKKLWTEPTGDRSAADFRLGHLMYANGFNKQEAIAVLCNSAKALSRAPLHRINYAENIVDKIWTFEENPDAPPTVISDTVRDILARGEETVKGVRFQCHNLIDDTVHGFRLGQVIGIIGGSGVGKTTLTLNTFLWFAERNPDYHHFFFSLEQPAGEIAARIQTICQGNEALFDKIHIVSNYADDGTFRNFSMDTVEQHLEQFTKQTGSKPGAVVIDHIGVLSKSDKNGEMEGLIGVCKRMKAVAVKMNCMLIMLSQAPREKAGIGDLELNKDAAYGTVFFEAYVDYLLCLWQPLKRAYSQGAPTVMAFKFAKIRHKKQGQDRIQEDTCYQLYFDPKTELLRELTQDEETAAKFFVGVSTNMRKRDRKTDVTPYESRRVVDAGTKTNDNTDTKRH